MQEARAEIEDLKIQAGVKRSKNMTDQEGIQDEAFLLHIESLSEALSQRDDLIRGLIERPKHPDTVALFEKIKIQSSKLKDLRIQD